MSKVVLSQIDPEKLVNEISERVTANVIRAVKTHQSEQSHYEQFLTVQEAAHFLNLSIPTIYSKVSKGELPVMKRSKRLYFSSQELTQYLKSGRRKSYKDIDLEADKYIKNSHSL
jgi:excisionase family DNA binding protein